MIVIKINYSSVSPVVNVNYDESPIYVRVMYGGAGDSITEWGEIIGTLSNQTDLQNALNAKVPYSGATANVDLGEYELKAGQIELDQSPTGVAGVAVTRWNDTIGSTETTLKGGSVVLKNGVDLVARVVNKVSPNTTLTKAAYQAVRISGAQGQRLAVAFAQANNDNNSADTIGLVTETIATNQEGFIMTVGSLEGINTTGSLQGETWSDGDVLYLSPTVAGAITNVKPVAPQHLVVIGYVEYAHQNNGKIYVKIMNGWELGELHDVNTTGASNGQVLTYNGSIWVPSTNGVGTVTSVDMTVPTGLTVSGNPITSSGTLALGLASGYSIPTDANQTNWTAAYNDKINSAAVTGTTTKTLTLNQQDGGTITASWTDYDTAPVTSVFGRTGAVVATSGDYTTDQVTEGTNLYFTDARARAAISLTTTGTSGAATYVGGVLNIPQYQAALTNPVTGTGTTNYIPKWTSGSALGNSQIFNNGSNVLVGYNNAGYINGLLSVGNLSADAVFGIVNSGTTFLNKINFGDGGFGDRVSLIANSSGDFYINNRNSVGTSNESLRVTRNNNLLIGTTTDGGQRLQVNGSARIGSTTASAMYWDDTNNRLGIGTNAPTSKLTIYDGLLGISNSSAGGEVFTIGVGATTSQFAFKSGGSDAFVYYTVGSGQTRGAFAVRNNHSDPNPAYTFLTDLNTGIGNAAGTADTLNFITNGIERVRIDANGNLGIGTTSPGNKFVVSNAGAEGFEVVPASNTNVSTLLFYNRSSSIYNTADLRASDYIFKIGTTERMRLDASGNLGIGTATLNSLFKITINSGTNINSFLRGDKISFSRTSDNAPDVVYLSRTNDLGSNGTANIQGYDGIQFRTQGPETVKATLTTTGNLLVGTTTDGGQKLQVSGSANVTGKLTASLPLSNTIGSFAISMNGDYTGFRTGVDGSFNIDVYKTGTGYINPFKIFETGAATFSSSVTAASYTVNDAGNIAVGTTTGTKIGTATSQKIGFWNATPIVQPTTAVAAAAFVANTGTAVNDASTFDGYTMAQVVKALRNAGLLA